MTETTALTVTQRAAVALQSDKAAAELAALVESSQSITAITNPDGRTECHAAAMKAKAARVAIEKTGKEARDDATAFSKAVIAEEKRLVAIIEPEQNRLLTLRDAWDAKIEAEKEAKRQEEAAKAVAIAKKIDAIKAIPLDSMRKSSIEIRQAIQFVRAIEIDDSYGDQFGAAKEARGDVLLKLIEMGDEAEEREAAAAKAAEEKRIADAKAEQERIEREAEAQRLREESARIRAENEAAAAKLKAEREAFEKQQAEQRADEEKARAELEREKAEVAAADAKRFAAERAELDRQRAEIEAQKQASQAIANAGHVETPVAAIQQPQTTAPAGTRMKLGEIQEALGFNVTADFLERLGFVAEIDRNAKLYRAADFPTICDRIAKHVQAVGNAFFLEAA